MAENPPANEGDRRDTGSVPESGRSPGGGNANPLQYSCLGNPMDRGAWQAIIHGNSPGKNTGVGCDGGKVGVERVHEYSVA